MGQTATFTSTAYTPDQLIAGNAALLYHEPVTLLAGQNLLRGALLGKITASGKYVLSLSAAVDGSQTPAAILVDDTNATAADVVTPAYFRGDFQAQAVILGASHTVASVRDALRAKNIVLFTTQGGV
jgi:hypothetical protein